MRQAVLVSAIFVAGSLSASGQESNWGQRMFDSLSHDFGVVARGADVRYRFKIKNPYNETIHIQSATPSCSCASAKLSTYSLASLEEGYLEVAMDTVGHKGPKSSSVVVTFDSPQYITVRLPVSAYIRSDVVLIPGSLDFGSVDQGASAERKIEVSYQGREDWKILSVKLNNKFISGKAVERERVGGHVVYDVVFSLKPDAPQGGIRDQIMLVTDDTKTPYVPILVNGEVESDVTITPPLLAYGKMKPGESKTINVVLRGKRPIVVDKFECESDRQAFRFRQPSGENRVHIVPLTLNAPSEAGKFTEIFTVTIAGRPQSMSFQATAEIIEAKK